MINLFFHAMKRCKFKFKDSPRDDSKHYKELYLFALSTQICLAQHQ